MKKQTKLKLEDIKLESYVAVLRDENELETIKGGISQDQCDSSSNTWDVLLCNTRCWLCNSGYYA